MAVDVAIAPAVRRKYRIPRSIIEYCAGTVGRKIGGHLWHMFISEAVEYVERDGEMVWQIGGTCDNDDGTQFTYYCIGLVEKPSMSSHRPSADVNRIEDESDY